VPRPLGGIAGNALVDETRDTADDQGDQINLTQHTFALDGRALLTLVGLSQEALKRTLKAMARSDASASSATPWHRSARCRASWAAMHCNGSFMLSAFSPGLVPACTFADAAGLAS
jgi:hypothetical protein